MTPAHLRQSAATSVATVDHRGGRRSKGGGLAVVGWSVAYLHGWMDGHGEVRGEREREEEEGEKA